VSVAEVLRYQATRQPENRAYTFLAGGQREAGWLTYAELDNRVRSVAALLQSVELRPRALLLFPPGLEFLYAFLGCTYAGVVAIPAPSPEGIRLRRTLPRLQAIARDAQPSVVLCSDQNLEFIADLCSQIPELARAKLLSMNEDVFRGGEVDWQPPDTNPAAVVYLQYTSGSTATPKGVMVTHANLMSNLRGITQAWEYSEGSVGVTWMPYFHDYGLVEGLLLPLYSGIPTYLISPIAFIKKPICWLQAISRYRVTHSGAPVFAYDLCVHKTTPEQRTGLDLSSWRIASLGAERISARTMKEFAETFTSYGFDENVFYPSYGLAEATLLVTTKLCGAQPTTLEVAGRALEEGCVVPATQDNGPTRSIVGCGTPPPSTKVIIVDPNKETICAADQIGEIWVSGSGVAAGYWQRVDETLATFQAYLANTGEGPFLRTGDLGFIRDGEVFVTGRLKDLIIVRGMNHHPEDIEQTVRAYVPDLAGHSGAAFAVDVDGEERLVITFEMKARSLSPEGLPRMVAAVQKIVAEEHDMRLYGLSLVRSGNLPRTSSGKIQRRLCRDQWLSGTLEVFAEWRESSTV
jgi:acyl-CoA synthetase (AMP-forming)/AMP-acid ligase II